jgi:protein gp37
MVKTTKKSSAKKWSGKVTRDSHALMLEEGVFTWADPRRIARSLKKSADSSTARKAEPFRSAMSMLVFYINRAGKNLDADQKRILEEAKDELRRLYGRHD